VLFLGFFGSFGVFGVFLLFFVVVVYALFMVWISGNFGEISMGRDARCPEGLGFQGDFVEISLGWRERKQGNWPLGELWTWELGLRARFINKYPCYRFVVE
jgi:hypothetical protein